MKTVINCGTLTNFCCESTARTAYFLNYHVVFGSDVNASDNALAHEADNPDYAPRLRARSGP
jgi:nicotinamidase-related amidase